MGRDFPTNPSYLPYISAYLFTLLQTVPLLLLATSFFKHKRSAGTEDVFFCRPESNVQYIWGNVFGWVITVDLIGLFSLLLTGGINLFVNKNSFCPGIYLFYWGTLIVPATLFWAGFFAFVASVVRHHLLGWVVLVGFCLFIFFVLGEVCWGTFNPFGVTLPALFSEITGHVGLECYLLQRGGWLFLGIGFVQLTVLRFRRLLNNPEKKGRLVGVTFGFLFIGVALLVVYQSGLRNRQEMRRSYAEVNQKYNSFPRLTLLSQHINYRSKGKRMEVKTRLELQNKTGKYLDQVILYLNPMLEILVLRQGDITLEFERDGQAVVVQKGVSPGETLLLDIEYAGKVDENVCYLDIPDQELFDEREGCYIVCRDGARYAFLDEKFTLLTPEVLW